MTEEKEEILKNLKNMFQNTQGNSQHEEGG